MTPKQVKSLKIGDNVKMYDRHLDIKMDVEISNIETRKSLGLMDGDDTPVTVWGRDSAGGLWGIGSYEFNTGLLEVS